MSRLKVESSLLQNHYVRFPEDSSYLSPHNKHLDLFCEKTDDIYSQDHEEQYMEALIKKLKGANMDIDLVTPPGTILWQQDGCPWNEAEDTTEHKCAVKNISICRYFCGIEYLDTLLCCYPHPNPLKRE